MVFLQYAVSLQNDDVSYGWEEGKYVSHSGAAESNGLTAGKSRQRAVGDIFNGGSYKGPPFQFDFSIDLWYI